MGDWNLVELWRSMGTLCHGVVIVLAIMFVRSISVSAGRALRYKLAREQSRAYIAECTVQLLEGELEQAIVVAEHNKKSHIAKIVAAGLLDYQAAPAGMPEKAVMEGVQRSLERSSAETTEEMKRGLSGLATIASAAPFVGLFGTVIGIITAFQKMASEGGGLNAVAGGISEALVTTAAGLAVAIPSVMVFNYFTNRVDDFIVDMNDVSSELVSFVLKEGRDPVAAAATGAVAK